jgi:beta-1,4-mannosyltransferase
VRAVVVVLGDLGQSPRTLFHARSLAAEGLAVDLIGTAASALPSFISTNRRIVVHTIADRAPRGGVPAASLPYLLGTVLRGTRLLMALTALLCWRLAPPDVILVQNPPGVPTMAVAWLAARWRSARLVVDWHNLTSAMLAIRLGPRHPLVTLVGRYEGLFGRAADANLFVSSHMQEMLGRRVGVRGFVFRDRPADTFAPLAAGERDAARARVFALLGASTIPDLALLVSPTSWTTDENLDLFLEALQKYDARARGDGDLNRLPSLAVLITGQGPLKRAFEERVAACPLERVRIQTGWLAAEEYARAIAAADLGICCHVSASGVDLPMKIVDLFGAGIPVCAYDYGPCLQELVSPGVNGVLFATADDCCDRLDSLLRGFPASNPSLERLRKGAAESARTTWGEGWIAEARAALIGSR